MPRAQRSARMRSATDAFCMSFSLTKSSGAIKTTVPRSTVVVLDDKTACVWIKRDRLSPKSVSLQESAFHDTSAQILRNLLIARCNADYLLKCSPFSGPCGLSCDCAGKPGHL